MPIGNPDWGIDSSRELITTIQDFGEILARQKYHSSLRREGNSLFFEDFQNGIRDFYFIYNDPYKPYITINCPYVNPYSLHFIPGNIAGYKVQCRFYFPSVYEGILGCEVIFTQKHWNIIIKFDISIYYKNVLYRFKIKYNPFTEQLSIADIHGYFFIINSSEYHWVNNKTPHTFKFLINPQMVKYYSMFLDMVEIDLSEYEVEHHDIVMGNHMFVDFGTINNFDNEHSLYLHAIRITNNE